MSTTEKHKTSDVKDARLAERAIDTICDWRDAGASALYADTLMGGEESEADAPLGHGLDAICQDAAIYKAAPDLLSACEELTAALDDMRDSSDYLPGERRVRLEAAKRGAWSAISKATRE